MMSHVGQNRPSGNVRFWRAKRSIRRSGEIRKVPNADITTTALTRTESLEIDFGHLLETFPEEAGTAPGFVGHGRQQLTETVPRHAGVRPFTAIALDSGPTV